MTEMNDGMPEMKTEEYWRAVEAVQVVNICTVLDEVRPNWLSNHDYSADSKAVKEWCAKNNAHYYAADRENFSKYEARRLAHDAGKTIVVVEDLS